jgi:hypothetical protein
MKLSMWIYTCDADHGDFFMNENVIRERFPNGVDWGNCPCGKPIVPFEEYKHQLKLKLDQDAIAALDGDSKRAWGVTKAGPFTFKDVEEAMEKVLERKHKPDLSDMSWQCVPEEDKVTNDDKVINLESARFERLPEDVKFNLSQSDKAAAATKRFVAELEEIGLCDMAASYPVAIGQVEIIVKLKTDAE